MRFVPNDTPITVGAIGLGYWGPNLARTWNSLEDSRLTWLCDLDGDRLTRHAALYPQARATRDIEDLLADSELDAVSIATSVPTHADLATRALAAGKHVFVEKPLALTAADARRVRALADDMGLLAMVGHLLVHHPGIQALDALHRSGELGRLHYVYTNRVNLGKVRADENALWSLGAHDVAVILHLMGSPPESVSAQGQCFLRPGVEDVVFGLLRFAGGEIAHLHMSWLDPHKMRRVTVVGSEKMAVFDDMSPDQKVTLHDKGVARDRALRRVDESSPPAPGSYGESLQVRYGDTFIPRISNEEPLRIQCRHFSRCVRGDEEPRSGAAHGVAVVEVLEALQRSLDGGGAVVPLAEARDLGDGVPALRGVR